QRAQLRYGIAKIIALTRGGRPCCSQIIPAPFRFRECGEAAGNLRREILMSTEHVEQQAMGVLVEQSAIVALAVDFDQDGANLAHELYTDRLIIDEGAAAAIGQNRAAQDEFILATREAIRFENAPRRMIARQSKARDRHRLPGAGAKRSASTAAFS